MKYLLLTLICLLSIQLWGQRPRYYNFDTETSEVNGPHDFPTDAIADDFGPRDLGDGWHGGIDYNEYQGANLNQKWDLIVSPVSGTIQDANHLIYDQTNEYKYGLVNVSSTYTLLFGHVFDDDHITYNEFGSSIVLKYCEPPFDDRWGLILNLSGNTYVYGQVDGATVVNGTDTYTTTNIIDDSAPFLPMGNSGGSYPVHLHLAMLPFDTEISSDNTNRNPCQYIDYDAPTYDISLWSELNGNGISVQYPGTASTKIAVRPSMQGESPGTKRYDVLMDVNTVSLHLNSMHSGSSQIIEGAEEEAIISLGARLGEDPVNHDIHYSYPGSIYQWEETGINSNAYNSDASGPNAMNPWDDYYFTDFISRIHQDDVMGDDTTEIAHCPMNTRYNDGSYEIKAEVNDVRDSSTTSGPVSFYIDNYKPFIQEVAISVDFVPVYHKYWDCDQGCDGIAFKEEFNTSTAPYGALFQLTATASEPLRELLLDIPSQSLFDITASNVSADSMSWEFSIDPSDLNPGERITLHFTGSDYSAPENALLQFSAADAGSCIKLPMRDGNQSWNNPDQIAQGPDTLHSFILECGGDQLKNDEDGGYTRSSSPADPTSIEWDADNCLDGAVEASITPASGPGASNGSIYLAVNPSDAIPPISYQWSNGSQWSSISNLIPGLYAVTITDSKCCTWEKIYSVGSECPDFLVLGANYQYACMNNSDGWLQLEAVNGESPYEVTWSTGDEGMLLENIPAGLYHFTITDAYGCTEESFVSLSEKSMTIEADIQTPCSPSQADGSIQLNVPGIGAWPYSYQWSDGSTSKNRSDLEGGTYCVTVTDDEGCSLDTCYVLDPTLEAFVRGFNNIGICGGIDGQVPCYGSIDVEVSTTADELTYEWSGPNNFSATTQDINQLCPGQYFLTVTDENGCTDNLSRDICCCRGHGGDDAMYSCGNEDFSFNLELETETTPAMLNNNGTIDLTVSGNNYYNYEYIWEHDSEIISNEEDLDELAPGEYCVTVSNGCIEESKCDTITQLPCNRHISNDKLIDIFLDEVVHPCGYSSNGSILLDVPNPHKDSVIVSLDEDTIISSYGQNPVEVFVGGLPGGIFNFNIEIDTCFYDVGIKLANLNKNLYSHYDKDTCFYHEICQGEIIDTFKLKAEYDLAEGSGGWFSKCEVPIKCDGMQVDVKSYPKETVQVAEYRARLDAARGLLGGTYGDLVNYLDSKNIGPCHYVRYCPTNFEITLTRPPFLGDIFPIPTPSSGTIIKQPASPCWHVDCDWPTSDYDFCIDHDDILGPENGINLINQCRTRVRERLLQVKLAEESGYLQQEFGDFAGSELDQLIDDYSEDLALNCAMVEYCLDDFSVYYTDINSVHCETLSPDCIKKHFSYEFYQENPNLSSCDIVFEDEEGLIVVCQNDFSCYFNPPKMAYFSKDGYGVWGLTAQQNSIDTIHKVLLDTLHAEYYKGMGLVKNFGRMIPWLMLDKDGQSIIYKYDHKADIIDKEETNDISAFRSDFLPGTVIKSVNQTDTLEILLYEDSTYTHAFPIAADDSFEVESLQYFSKSETIQMYGTFTGNLYFDNTVLDHTNSTKYYFLQFDKTGTVLAFQSILNNDQTDVVIDQTSQYKNLGVSFSTAIRGQDLVLNDTVLSFSPNDRGLCIVRLDSTLAFDGSKYLGSDSEVELIDFDMDSTKHKYRIIAQSNDDLMDGDSVISIDSAKYILLAGSMDDGYSWHLSFDTLNLKDSSLHTVQNIFGQTYLSCTFENQISIGDEFYISEGGEDILILRFDTTGQLTENGKHQWGSSEDEDLREIMYDKGILYFAGFMEGNIIRRTIGNYSFLSFQDHRFYLSYITDELPSGEGESARSAFENMISDAEQMDCKVFPNPFSDKISLECEVEYSSRASISIFDIKGKKVFYTETQFNEGKNIKNINDVSGLSPGVYIMKLMTEEGRMYHSKIVKKSL